MAVINFDAVEPLAENTVKIAQISQTGFVESMTKLANVLKDTVQEEPIIQEIMGLSGVVENHYNELLIAINTHRKDLGAIGEIAEALKKRETGVQVAQAEEVGVQMTARVDAIRNL